MPTDILMPALSPTMEEGKLAKWLVKEGQQVKPGDIIAEIETDKATMEVEAVDEGNVSKLLVAEGTEGVKVNTPIATLLVEGETSAPTPVGKPTPGRPAAPPAPSAPAKSPVAAPAEGEQGRRTPAAAPARTAGSAAVGGQALRTREIARCRTCRGRARAPHVGRRACRRRRGGGTSLPRPASCARRCAQPGPGLCLAAGPPARQGKRHRGGKP